MEEILIYAILLSEELMQESEYNNLLDKLFLTDPENDDLLYLEWEKDIKKALVYIRTHIDYNNFDFNQFGKILMCKLKVIYTNCTDFKLFSNRMYNLWLSLPENIQNIEPFQLLCYADDSLSWGDENQARNIYEYMLNYYESSTLLGS